MKLALAVLALVVAAPAPTLPGAKAIRSCAGAGPYWPTQTLALTPGFAWVACKEQQRVLRVPLQPGRSRSIPVSGQPIAVLSAFGAVWALERAGRSPGSIRRPLGSPHACRRGHRRRTTSGPEPGRSGRSTTRRGEVIRIDPIARKVTQRIPVGDGAADLVFRGRARVGDQPPRPRPRSDRRRDEPAPPPHHCSRRRARADGVVGGVALGDRPRHRPASARSGNRRCSGDDRDRRGRNRRRRRCRRALGARARSGRRSSRLSHHDLAPPRRSSDGKGDDAAADVAAHRCARPRPVPARCSLRGQHRRLALRSAPPR